MKHKDAAQAGRKEPQQDLVGVPPSPPCLAVGKVLGLRMCRALRHAVWLVALGPALAATPDAQLLLGIWNSSPESCQERYRFFADGGFVRRSDFKTTTGSYEVVAVAQAAAVSRLTLTVKTDNGFRNCEGSLASTVGQRSSLYVVPGTSAREIRLCATESGQSCGAAFSRNAVAGTFGPDELFDWAERTYPGLFPGPALTQWLSPYFYRYYPASGNYVGVAGDDVNILGPVSGGALQRVGSLVGLRCQVQGCVGAPVMDSVVAGPGMSAAISDAGDLFIWGSDSDQRLAQGAPVPGSTARKVAAGVQQVALGTYAAMYLTGDGKLFEWSSVSAWNLADDYGDLPVQIPLTRPVRQLTFDGFELSYFTAVRLQDNGEPLGAGVSNAPELRELNRLSGSLHAIRADGVAIPLTIGNLGSFRPIEGATDMTMISCSGSHCLGLRADGTVVAWGDDPLNLIPIPDPSQRKFQSRPVAGLSNIVKVAAGDGTLHGYSAALTADGKLMIWGDHGSLFRPVQLQVSGMERIVDVHCGTHCLARTADGSVWAWGKDRLAMTGVGKPSEKIAVPQRVPGVMLGTR